MRCIAVTIALATAVSWATGAVAENVRLTVVSGYPPTAAWVSQFEKVFVPEVERKLAETGQHSISWNLSWGTIVNPAGEFGAVETGLADMGIVQTVFHPDKVGIYNIAYVTPFVSNDIASITSVVNELAVKYPAMKEIWTRYDQHMLTTLAAVNNYQIVLRDKASGPADLAGRKICGAGLNLRYIEGQGVVGVPSPLSEWYNNIRSGICDGTIVWPEAVVNFKLQEVAPFMLDVSFGGVNSMALTINASKWDSLPGEVRDALTSASESYRVALADFATSRSAESIEAYIVGGGSVISLDQAARKAWAASIPPIAAEWAADQKARGVPADEILADYLALLTERGAAPLRDWTK